MFHRVNSIPYSGGSSKFLISFVHFLSGASSYFNYIISKLHLIIARLLPEFFSTFHFVWSFFYYRSSSWRLYMVVRQGFLSFFNCFSRFLSELWSVKLYSKINMVLNTYFVLWSSSILHLAFRSAILSLLSFEMVLCHSWLFSSCFMIPKLSRMRYLNPSYFSSSMSCFNSK